MMKFLLIFVVILISVNAEMTREFKDQVMKEIQQEGLKCVEQENASGDDISQIMAKELPTSKEGKCLLACFNQAFLFQTKEGKLDQKGALKTIEPFKEQDAEVYNKMKKIIDTCMPEVGDPGDRCETALKYVICLKRVAKEIGITEEIFA